jgi:hypothetical protein
VSVKKGVKQGVKKFLYIAKQYFSFGATSNGEKNVMMNDISEDKLRAIAAEIDRGCWIGIVRPGNSYSARLVMRRENPERLEIVRTCFAATTRVWGVQDGVTCYVLRYQGTKLILMLEAVRPYLVKKARHADVVVEFGRRRHGWYVAQGLSTPPDKEERFHLNRLVRQLWKYNREKDPEKVAKYKAGREKAFETCRRRREERERLKAEAEKGEQ